MSEPDQSKRPDRPRPRGRPAAGTTGGDLPRRCPHCGKLIAPEGTAGEAAELTCPHCGLAVRGGRLA